LQLLVYKPGKIFNRLLEVTHSHLPACSALNHMSADFVTIYGLKGMRKGFTFGVKPKPQSREVAPGPHYEVGASTLGVGASQQVGFRCSGLAGG
jgi:hypothetical protein